LCGALRRRALGRGARRRERGDCCLVCAVAGARWQIGGRCELAFRQEVPYSQRGARVPSAREAAAGALPAGKLLGIRGTVSCVGAGVTSR
ncbi:unnamed protein product, partial [Ectocarpus sp. 12 AP-2014]